MSLPYCYRFAFLLLFCTCNLAVAQPTHPPGRWVSLFDGKTLAGWDTHLRQPEGTNQAPFGLNNDPLRVFTVANGTVRVSGQVWGGISTRQEYANYHLRFQMRWGEKKWYSSDTTKRDSGLLYHATGPFSFAYGAWLRSSELQIQEGEIGDFFGVGAGSAEFSTQAVSVRGKTLDQYNLAAPLRRNADAIGAGRVYRSGDFERPHGEWNTVELITRQADAVYIVNGYVVNRLFNMYRPAIQQQTTRGKIQFQSEGAEVFYQQIELRPVDFTAPTSVSLTANQSLLNNLAPGTPQTVQITNRGDAIELVAVELTGPVCDGFVITLPTFPKRLAKGEALSLPVSVKPGLPAGTSALLRLETVLGPVPDLTVQLQSR